MDEYPDEAYEDIASGRIEIAAPPAQQIDPSDMGQYALLSYALANPTIWTRCAPILKTEYFDPEFRPVIDLINQYRSEYNRLPSPLTIQGKTNVRLETPADASDLNVMTAVCNDIEAFVRNKATELFLYNAAEAIGQDPSGKSTPGLFKQMQEISRIAVHRDLGQSVFRDMHAMLEANKDTDLIPTGMAMLDRCFDGGTEYPSLNLVSASSGYGKSIWLQNIAMNYAVLFGVNVVFYTLELEPKTIFKRFAAMMSDTAMGRVYQDRDQVVFKLKGMQGKSGDIMVKKFPMVGTTMADIQAHYQDLTLETGEDWPIVGIDYIDVMTPMRKGIRLDDIHLRDKAISEEMNDFAHDPTCYKIVWSASQQIKGAETETNSNMGSVAGGKDKVSTCDNLIILKRSQDDRMEERGWGYIQKARSSGGSGLKFPFRWNAETQRMTSWPDEELLLEANPVLRRKAGARDKTRVEKDPIAREQGVVVPEEKPKESGQAKTGRKVQDKVIGMIQKKAAKAS